MHRFAAHSLSGHGEIGTDAKKRKGARLRNVRGSRIFKRGPERLGSCQPSGFRAVGARECRAECSRKQGSIASDPIAPTPPVPQYMAKRGQCQLPAEYEWFSIWIRHGTTPAVTAPTEDMATARRGRRTRYSVHPTLPARYCTSFLRRHDRPQTAGRKRC
jgi:hypothetical protein